MASIALTIDESRTHKRIVGDEVRPCCLSPVSRFVQIDGCSRTRMQHAERPGFRAILRFFKRPADCQSAIRQVAKLRYKGTEDLGNTPVRRPLSLHRATWQTLQFIHLLFAFTSFLAFAAETTNAPIKDLGEGRFRIGAVTIDSKGRILTFPAHVNMVNGVVEYLIVTTQGKVHESLLSTTAEPVHIHTAMLLLGVTNSTNIEAAAFFDAKREIPGRRIQIDVAFANAAPVEIQTLLAFAQSKQPLKGSDIPHWIYNGSRFSDTPGLEPGPVGSPPRAGNAEKEPTRVFMAQREGSIVSLIADPSALVNNPRKDRENDELWILHTAAIPPVGTRAQVTFKLKMSSD